MANNYFQFKQFLVCQDQSAMKVCTDSCVFGAFISVETAQNILDIGTGTGLLALMLAQRTDNQIDAVEIEQSAFEQACENVQQSPWQTQIKVYHKSIQDFINETNQAKYDLIVSNPPFFKNNWQSNHANKNLALHSEALSFEDLLKAVDWLLAENGAFWVLLPEYEMQVLEKKAERFGLKITEKLNIYNRPATKILRVIAKFINNSLSDNYEIVENDFYIRDSQNQYTDEFRTLLKDYYLIF